MRRDYCLVAVAGSRTRNTVAYETQEHTGALTLLSVSPVASRPPI